MNFFNLNVADALTVWDGVKSRIEKTISQPRGSDGLDYSFITPSILALAKFQDDKIGELSQIIQGNSVVLWNLSGKPFSASTKDAMNNQILEALWLTPGQFTQAPSLECLFSHCHSIKCWLDLDSNHVAIIHCGNGRSRSGILIACLLKQMGAFEQSSLAFDFFCSARSQTEVKPTLAPSYRVLFENIDQAVNHGGYPNRLPLHLKCVAISGLPVDEIPCVEIWDTTGVIFNSHNGGNKNSNKCTWSAEYGDGFFRVTHDILGDFSVMCRFGGSHASTRDKTTLIFKYQNSTAFLTPEVIELKRHNVDINPEYSDSLDNELFTVHLMFEKSQEKDKTKVLPDRIFDGSGSVNYFEAGMNEISKHHIQEIDQVKNSMLIEMGLPERFTTVALQLANNGVDGAAKYVQLMKQREYDLQKDSNCTDVVEVNKSKQERRGSWNGDEAGNKTKVEDSICRVCNDDNSMKKDQLIPCKLCSKYFHTTCCGARRIPFSLKTLKEKQNRDKFIKKHYSEWSCSTCSSPDASGNTEVIQPAEIITNDPKISGTARRRSSLSNVKKNDVQFSTILPNYSQAWNPTMLSTGDVGYKKVVEMEGESLNVSKNDKHSKHDQAAFLIGILAASGYHIENLMAMSEEKQREALETATNHYNSKTCTPLKPKTDNLDHVNSIGTAENSKELAEKLKLLSSNGTVDETCTTSSSVLPKRDPKYEKYVKMTITGVPLMAVAQKMVNESVVNSIEHGAEILNQISGNTSVSSNNNSSSTSDVLLSVPSSGDGKVSDNSTLATSLTESNDSSSTSSQQVKLSEHPQYSKFFRMLKSGVPVMAIKKSMTDAAVDISIIDRNPDELVALQQVDDVVKVAVGSHPTYVKYFKMLKSGIPIEAIKNNMQRDKIDSTYLDKDPNEMIPLNDDGGGINQKVSQINIKKSVKQSAVRKKRLHWKALDSSQVGFKDSVWANDKDDDIKLDEEEFNQLFVDSGDSQDIRKDKTIKETTKKKRINIIDMKRAQNGGISLSRIRIAFPDVRTKIENMQDESFSTDQLLSLAEFLPMNDEQQLLKAYKGDIELLGPVEKYMIVMLNFPSASDRILSMVYKQQFKGRVQECTTTLTKIESACDDVKMCSKLKKVLKTILKVGNQMNDGEEHAGFTLDSLLKLQSAKAFDKKTSILQYVIMLIQRNDESILQFPSDLPHISDASRLILDSVTQEGFQLRQGLHHAFELIKSIRNNEQGNGGDTSTMTEFLYKATKKCDELEESIEKVKTKFASVLAYFGEAPAMPSHDFFSTLSKFVQEFVVTRDAVIRKIKSDSKNSNKEISNSNTSSKKDNTQVENEVPNTAS